MYDLITEKLFAPKNAIRRLPNPQKGVYLTFDDGPDAEFTPEVLRILKSTGARATFFVIGRKARGQRELVQDILAQGHRLGNHSVDHDHSVFFSDAAQLTEWVQRGEQEIQKLSGGPSVGFRPPNGVVTPHLIRALDGLDQPLILWNCRFFDTLVPWTEKSAIKALRKLQSGDIILLHDTQKAKWRPVFLQTLEKFIREGQLMGWRFEPLPEKNEMNGLTKGRSL